MPIINVNEMINFKKFLFETCDWRELQLSKKNEICKVVFIDTLLNSI